MLSVARTQSVSRFLYFAHSREDPAVLSTIDCFDSSYRQQAQEKIPLHHTPHSEAVWTGAGLYP